MKIQIPNTTKDITVEQYAKWNMVADDTMYSDIKLWSWRRKKPPSEESSA